jgi:hypothetical protein
MGGAIASTDFWGVFFGDFFAGVFFGDFLAGVFFGALFLAGVFLGVFITGDSPPERAETIPAFSVIPARLTPSFLANALRLTTVIFSSDALV